jgi:hypothetical protein
MSDNRPPSILAGVILALLVVAVILFVYGMQPRTPATAQGVESWM